MIHYLKFTRVLLYKADYMYMHILQIEFVAQEVKCSGVHPSGRRRTTSTISNIFSSETNSSQILFRAPVLRTKVCSRHLSHMTKMAATPIKNLSKIFFSGNGGPISTKLGVKHQRLLPIIVCSSDDPGVTLTYLTARSNFVT